MTSHISPLKNSPLLLGLCTRAFFRRCKWHHGAQFKLSPASHFKHHTHIACCLSLRNPSLASTNTFAGVCLFIGGGRGVGRGHMVGYQLGKFWETCSFQDPPPQRHLVVAIKARTVSAIGWFAS